MAKPAKPVSYKFSLGAGKFALTGQAATAVRHSGVRPPVAQVVSFFTGFETGDNGEVVTTGTGQTIQTTTVRTGGYALKTLSGTTTCEMVAGLSATQWVIRFYMRLSGAVAGFHAVLEQTGSGTSRLALDVTSASKLQVNDQGATLGLSTVTGTTVLNNNQWYRIEVVFDAAANGVVKAYIDGVQEISTTHTSNVSGTVTTIMRGLGGDATNGVFYDDIRLDTGGTSLIGAGQCIARQGLNSHATTPTYNAWTKNGTTDAGTAWSDTPESASKNCSSASTSAVQTMVVDKFSVDPSRAVEGTQTVPSGATINACKIIMLAKATSIVGANNQLTIRRRVNSTDTDQLMTLTATFDTYYTTSFFTDTAANLDGYEIGVEHSVTGLTTQTVEDMWMMVDYVPTVSYTFSIGAGSYTLTGEPLTLPVSRKISLGVGAYALTGEPLTITVARKAFLLGAGVYALTGEALTQAQSRLLGTGVFVLTGEPLTFHTSRNAFALDTGVFAMTGEPLTFPVNRKISLAAGSFIFTGESLTFDRNATRFALDTGVFIVTGEPLIFSKTKLFALDTGVYTYRGGGLFVKNYPFLMDAGAYIVTGEALKNAFHVPLGTGTYSFVGRDIQIKVVRGFQHAPPKPPKQPPTLERVRRQAPVLENWRPPR